MRELAFPPIKAFEAASTDVTQTLSIETVRNMILGERRRVPDGVVITCHRLGSVAYTDIIDLILKLTGTRGWSWADKTGAQEAPRSWSAVLWALVRDGLIWPVLYLRHSACVRRLSRASPINKNFGDSSRILYLRTDHIYDVDSGGALAHITGVVNAFVGWGWVVEFVTTDPLPGLLPEARTFVLPPVYDRGRNIPNMAELEYTDQAARWVEKNWPVISPSFIYQRSSRGNYTGALLSRRLGVPLVYEYNGSLTWVARHWGGRASFHERLLDRVEQASLDSAELIVAVSTVLRDELVDKGLDPAKIIVNFNGVDVDAYHPDVDGAEVRGKYALGDEIVIGFSGTFAAWHGAEVLADAFGLLLQQWPELRTKIRLLMIGDGHAMSDVKKKLKRHGVIDHCILAGAVPQEDVPKHLSACDILASPHVPNPDGSPFFGSPTKLFEYMAMGRGIVASDLDQIGEVIEHERTGWLVEPGNAGALAEGLRILIEDRPLRQRLGTDARQRAESRFTWRRHAQRILEALEGRCGSLNAGKKTRTSDADAKNLCP